MTGRSLDARVAANRRGLAATTAGLFACFVVSWVLAKTTGAFAEPDGEMSQSLGSFARRVIDAETFLAGPRAVIPTVFLLAVVGYLIGGRRWALMCLAPVFVVVFTTLTKTGVGPSTALPSGHTAYATAMFGMGALIAVANGRRFVGAALVALAVLMNPARVIEGAHTVPDVLAGDALGLGWLLLILLVGTSDRFVRAVP